MAAVDDVIATALRQVGKPYVFGEDGPTSFDCSGLISYAFGLAGISLPHNAALQQKRVSRIAPQEARPGDLVFYGWPAHHVALYLGGGRQVAAPHSGANVQVQKVASNANYGRVAGLGIGSTPAASVLTGIAQRTGSGLTTVSYSIDDIIGQARGVSLQVGATLAGLAIVGVGLYVLVGRRAVGALQGVQGKVQSAAANII